jgi:hypothetical protein
MAGFHLTISLRGHTLTIQAGPTPPTPACDDQPQQSSMSPGATTETVYRDEPQELRVGFARPPGP